MTKHKSNLIRTEPAFKAISDKIHDFNPLKILGVQGREVRHSKILAWLLDPKENHNFKDIFLKEFIKSVHLNEQLHEKITILDEELDDIQIITEWTDETQNKHKIDIVGVSENHKFVLVIENKINSSEGDGQLSKYRKMIKEQFPNYTYLPVFLTVTGEKPSIESDWYKTFSHEDIYLILKNIKNSAISIKINFIEKQYKIINFIDDYMNILEELTLPNDSIIHQSLELNNKYGEVIQDHESYLDWFKEEEIEVLKHIRFYVKSLPFSNFRKAWGIFQIEFSANFMTGESSDNEIYTDEYFYKSRREYWFIPAQIYNESDKRLEASNWRSPSSIAYFFKLTDSTLSLNMQIGPVNFTTPSNKASSRDELLKLITNDEQGDFDLIKPKKQNTQKWVTLFSQEVKSVNVSDHLEIFETMKDLYVNKFGEANDQIQYVMNELYN